MKDCTTFDTHSLQETICAIDASLPTSSFKPETLSAIQETITHLNNGTLRIASPQDGGWKHHAWIQKAVHLYLKTTPSNIQTTPWLHKDKIAPKYSPSTLAKADVRMVPPAFVRYGAYLEPGIVLMPCFVNIGAYVGSGTMLDTWCTVGSCAQIGKRVHISGGAGIGGVLEPATAQPTIIEDDCFIGARSEIAEGVRVCKGAVIASGVFLTQGTKIYDRTCQKVYKGIVPENAVVVPGSLPAHDGSHSVQAAIIVKYADEKTRGKTALNDWLRTS